MSKHKITVRNSPGWRNFHICTLGVSVPSSNWQDDHFASILGFAAANFTTIRIDVTDRLYRHNFMARGLSPAEAEARADALGEEWIKRHRRIIDGSPVKPDVIRWKQWHEHPNYATVLEGFQYAAAVNSTLNSAIENDVDMFCRRQNETMTATGRQHSRDFLIEELAVMTLQARELPHLRMYPGEQLDCVHAVRTGLIPEAPRGLEREQFARLDIRTRDLAPIPYQQPSHPLPRALAPACQPV
jgi:tRNA-dependent cyclodipeptide synthase